MKPKCFYIWYFRFSLLNTPDLFLFTLCFICDLHGFMEKVSDFINFYFSGYFFLLHGKQNRGFFSAEVF